MTPEAQQAQRPSGHRNSTQSSRRAVDVKSEWTRDGLSAIARSVEHSWLEDLGRLGWDLDGTGSSVRSERERATSGASVIILTRWDIPGGCSSSSRTAANLPVELRSRYPLRFESPDPPNPTAAMHDNAGQRLAPEVDRDRLLLFLGDSVTILPQLARASADALVTDPPYGLAFNGNSWDAMTGFAESLPDVDLSGMGPPEVFEAWCAAWARGALHVLKPGAHLAAFGGTRTWHRMVRGIENAGFEVRDQIAWLYSSGMPKSMDIAQSLDKRAGAHRPDRVVQQSATEGVLGATRRVVQHGTAVTEAAKQWEGWGTGLRPAFEPIIIARKPMPGTVIDNVVEHGTGAIHIDAARFGDGRWPANVALDPPQASALDLLTGTWHQDALSARFPVFQYEHKAPNAERPRAFGLSHSTVKPLSLMRWLVRLLTPPGGTVLEPFAGSGTTIEASLREGFQVVAVEKDSQFSPLIQSRLDKICLESDELGT